METDIALCFLMCFLGKGQTLNISTAPCQDGTQKNITAPQKKATSIFSSCIVHTN